MTKISDMRSSESRVNKTNNLEPKRLVSPINTHKTVPTTNAPFNAQNKTYEAAKATSSPSPIIGANTTAAPVDSSSESSIKLLSEAELDPKIPVIVSVRKPTPPQPEEHTRHVIPPSYLPSDPYHRRPEIADYFFYHRLLTLMKHFRNVLGNERPHEPRYKPYADIENSRHVYDEPRPVVHANRETYSPESAPSSYRPIVREAAPISVPAAEEPLQIGHNEQLAALPIRGHDRKVIGYLPVFAVPRKPSPPVAED